MKIKAKIDGRSYIRTVKKFYLDDGGSIGYITVNHVPYIIQKVNGVMRSLMTLDQFKDNWYLCGLDT